MKKNVEIRISQSGESIGIKNNLGGHWFFKTNRPVPLISALVGLSVAEWFDQQSMSSMDFVMTLDIQSLDV